MLSPRVSLIVNSIILWDYRLFSGHMIAVLHNKAMSILTWRRMKANKTVKRKYNGTVNNFLNQKWYHGLYPYCEKNWNHNP